MLLLTSRSAKSSARRELSRGGDDVSSRLWLAGAGQRNGCSNIVLPGDRRARENLRTSSPHAAGEFRSCPATRPRTEHSKDQRFLVVGRVSDFAFAQSDLLTQPHRASRNADRNDHKPW